MRGSTTAAVPRYSYRQIVIALLGIIAFALLYVVALRAHQGEAETNAANFVSGRLTDADRLNIVATVMDIDVVKGELEVILDFRPQGALTTDRGWAIAQDLDLFVNSATGKQEFFFEKGSHLNPLAIQLNLYPGQASNYPFDEHNTELLFDLRARQGEKATVTDAPVPLRVDFFGAAPGLRIEAFPHTEDDDVAYERRTMALGRMEHSAEGPEWVERPAGEQELGYVAIHVKIVRSATVLVFVLIAMATMWAITFTLVFLLGSVVLRGRQPELGMLGLNGSMLFAFWALRNSLPDTPPVGTSSDFLAFFWAEMITAIILVIMIIVWLRHPVPPKNNFR